MPILYPFYERVKVENTNITVWLTEDNAPAYMHAVCRFEE